MPFLKTYLHFQTKTLQLLFIKLHTNFIIDKYLYSSSNKVKLKRCATNLCHRIL